jgi:hypothetical protein
MLKVYSEREDKLIWMKHQQTTEITFRSNHISVIVCISSKDKGHHGTGHGGPEVE